MTELNADAKNHIHVRSHQQPGVMRRYSVAGLSVSLIDLGLALTTRKA